MLRAHARHYETGAPLPDALLAKLQAARRYGQGFAAVEYTVCALVDQALHALPADAARALDMGAFEAAELAKLRLPAGISMRHRPAHFSHLFSGPSYAAAYYCYMWAEVLDADAFEAFTETGDLFNPAVAAKLRAHIYAAGNSAEPGATYRAFRGRDPEITPMLRKKGLLEAA